MFQGWELEPKTVTIIIFPDEQGLCVQTVSVSSCMPLFGEGKWAVAGLNIQHDKFCDSESGTSEEKVALMNGFMCVAVPDCSGW